MITDGQFYGIRKTEISRMSSAETVNAPNDVAMIDENKIINIDILVIVYVCVLLFSLFFK